MKDSLRRYLYCEHCGRRYVGTFNHSLQQYVLVCPLTGQQQRVIPAREVATLPAGERDVLMTIVPDANDSSSVQQATVNGYSHGAYQVNGKP